VAPDLAAKTGVWLVRLHGPERSIHMERERRAQQARSEAHRVASEPCTNTWQDGAEDYATADA
jgi:ferric-dicitrate binding protein FerR (iron transport regulator)